MAAGLDCPALDNYIAQGSTKRLRPRFSQSEVWSRTDVCLRIYGMRMSKKQLLQNSSFFDLQKFQNPVNTASIDSIAVLELFLQFKKRCIFN